MSNLPVAVRGALWMVGALVSFSLMAVSVRELLHTMGSFEILFMRSFVSFVLLLFLLPGRVAALRTHHFGLHVLRNAFHFGGQYAWVYAICLLPLAPVFAIEFTMPVWAAILAMLFLGERLNQGRVVMLVLGLVGVLVMLRPGMAVIQPAALVMLLGAFAYATTMITTKRLSGHDSAFAIMVEAGAEEHTPELQSLRQLECRLLLEENKEELSHEHGKGEVGK